MAQTDTHWQALADHAQHAHQNADWPEAEARWRAMRAAFPHIFYSYTGGAAALANLGQHEQAMALLAKAADRFPWERAIPQEAGRIAMATGDWIAAEAHWRRALAFDRPPWWVYTELAGALEHQDRLDEADAVLTEARTRSSEPDEITLFIYPARLAARRGQWALAVQRWDEARRRFPDIPALRDSLNDARMRLGHHDPVAYETTERALARHTQDPLRDLALRFESLGGTGPGGGAEFGFFQRAHDAEPLGLFRWATVPVAGLIAGLNRRFHGIGDPASLSLTPRDGQWDIADLTYGTETHSFVPCPDVPRQAMIERASNRMRFLAAKLIGDLTSAAKIFVLKSAWRPVTEQETWALAQAIRSYGHATLLIVSAADATHPRGLVAPAAPGVLLGYLDFAAQPSIERRWPAWQTLCRQALAMARSPETAMAFARSAMRTGDWRTAQSWWQTARSAPQPPWQVFAGLARALERQGRADEADAVLRDGRRHHPHQVPLIREHARLAAARGDWQAAERHWTDAIDRAPDDAAARGGLAQALIRQHRRTEAEAALRDIQTRHPQAITGFLAQAHITEDQADLPAALRLWHHLRDRFPDHPQGHAGVIRTLRRLGRINEAAPILLQAIARFGDDADILIELARFTLLIGWPEQALTLCADIQRNDPDDLQAVIEAQAIRQDAARQMPTAGTPPSRPAG